MNNINILFFGSTTDSVIVLDKIYELRGANPDLRIVAIVTQPPRPIGRKQIITQTPTEVYGHKYNITVLSFPSDPDMPSSYANEETVVDTLESLKADLLISASYGQKIPTQTIREARCGGLNVHPSLLPRWRGADPVPRMILAGDHQAGVTVVTLSEKFDEGKIIAQKKIPLRGDELSDPLRAELFTMGAELLADVLPTYITGSVKGHPQGLSDQPTSKRFTRDDGFEPWEAIQRALSDAAEARRIEAKYRAFHPWPGLWTRMPNRDNLTSGLRLKILACHLVHNEGLAIDTVQLEGKNPTSYSQFLSAHTL